MYSKALLKRNHRLPQNAPPIRLTVQGGVGTPQEAAFLQTHYAVDSVGWGSPFLLVPEVTNVDEEHLKKLALATEDDVILSDASPLGVPFWLLKSSESEMQRQALVESNRAGSVCPKGYLAFNTEFTTRPICTASVLYQRKKLAQHKSKELPPAVFESFKNAFQAKACLCRDLAGSMESRLNPSKKLTTAVCPGPNIVNFSKVITLTEMVDFIYARNELMTQANRPHLFIKELRLNIDYLKDESKKYALERIQNESIPLASEHFSGYIATLEKAIGYYETHIIPLLKAKEDKIFLKGLREAEKELKEITAELKQADRSLTLSALTLLE